MNSRTPSMFSNRTIGFYLGLAAGVMAIVSLVAYAMYAVAAGSYNVWVIAPLVRVPVNSFEFHSCERTPQVEYLMRLLRHRTAMLPDT